MNSSPSAFTAQEISRCRGFVAVCTLCLFGFLFLWAFPIGLALYALAQIAALGAVVWAGRLLDWGAIRVLLYLALTFIPLANWLALGDIHRALGKRLRAESSSEHNGSGAVIAVVAIVAIMGLALAFKFGVGSDSGHENSPSGADTAYQPPPGPAGTEALEAELGAMLTAFVAEQRQQIFNALHPTGTVTDSKVHEAKVTKWRKGIATNRPEDIAEFVVRYTIYWEGPVTRDGYTKIAQTYDAEVGRYTKSEILATNGVTNDEAAQAAGFVFGVALRHAIESAASE
jgi:hypothetical protein